MVLTWQEDIGDDPHGPHVRVGADRLEFHNLEENILPELFYSNIIYKYRYLEGEGSSNDRWGKP